MATRKKPKKELSMSDITLEVSKNYNPEKYPEFLNAIKSGCLDEHAARIEVYMQHRDFMRLGTLIAKAVVDKVTAWQTEEMAKIYNDSLGGGDEQN